MVETKTLTIPVSVVPPGVADMRFDAWDPWGVPPETREIMAKKTEYEPGELVKVKYKVKNVGDGAGEGSVEIKDVATGAVLKTYPVPSLSPGETWRTLDAGLDVGPMPNKDWALSFKVTP